MAKKNVVRSVKFTTRLTATERKNLNAHAKRMKMTPSALVRRLISAI
jgi:hypothetical protein